MSKMAVATINAKCKFMHMSRHKNIVPKALYKLEASFYKVVPTLSSLSRPQFSHLL